MTIIKFIGFKSSRDLLTKYILIIVCLSWNLALDAQEITISGSVIDIQIKEPLPFATITVTVAGSGELVTGGVNDDKGFFSLEGDLQGKYSVNVSYMGFATEQIDLLVGELNQHFDLGRIELLPMAENLDEVSVSAMRQELTPQLDKKSFQMDDMLAQSGGSVLDAMKTLPGVTVDQEGKVILRGSDKVVVLINGKQSSLTGFGNQKGMDNIPATNVEKIEIINNPSARYDARDYKYHIQKRESGRL